MPYDDPMNPDPGPGSGTGGTSAGPTGRDQFLAWARPVLSRVYKMYLGRDITDDEFAGYTGPNASQGTVQQAADAVMGSPESKAYQTANPGLWGQEPHSGTTSTTTNTGGGGGGGGNPTDNFPPYNNPYNPPPTINQGGPNGLEYIPPVPQFGAPDFHAPNANDVLKDPGYQFRLGQGEQALEQSAAARGLLNSGGTMKDILGYGQNFASQEYGNVYDRSERAYNLAYRGAQDEFAPLMHQYDTLAAAGQHQNDLNYQHAWDKWIEDYNIFRNGQNDRFDRLYRTSTA